MNHPDGLIGLIQTVGQQRPVLQTVSMNARLGGLLLEATVRQSYRNTSGQALEVVYTFALWRCGEGRRVAAAPGARVLARGRIPFPVHPRCRRLVGGFDLAVRHAPGRIRGRPLGHATDPGRTRVARPRCGCHAGGGILRLQPAPRDRWRAAGRARVVPAEERAAGTIQRRHQAVGGLFRLDGG